MGNLSSQEEDSYYTDDSLSVMSEQSARMQPSRRNPNVPVEPPEADLSHLTEEERAHILSVLARARDLQARDERRVRDLEDEFSNYAASVLQKASDVAAVDTVEGAVGKHRDLCPICHVTELVPDPQPGTAQEGQACGDCDRIVCLQCGFYTPAVTSDTETWLCNMCQRRRRFLATSGLWHVGRRNKRFSGSRLQRRSSLDETESALKRAAKKHRKLERMASYSQYEEMKAQPDQQRTPEAASPTSLPPLQGATASSPSSVSAAVGACASEPKTATDRREGFATITDSIPPSKPPRSISREDERSTEYPSLDSSVKRNQERDDLDAEEGTLEAVAARDLEKQQGTSAVDSDGDFDEDEMMRQLLEMAGDDDEVTSCALRTSDTGDHGSDHRTNSLTCYRDTACIDTSAQQDFSNNNATVSCEEYSAQPDSAQTGQDKKELIHHQRSFGDLDVLYEGDELEGMGDWESGGRARRHDADGALATTLLTERERELIRDSCKETRTKNRGFIDHRSSSVDSSASDEPRTGSKRKILSCSFDSYESLSDSEIKSTKARQNANVQKMGIMSGSDPKLSSASDPPSREPITSSTESLQKLFVPQLSPEEFVSDEKYRSVEDLTKVGKDEPETAVEEESSCSRVATPAVGQPQFQFVKQKPNSLPRRRRSKPVMELPLSPIFDEETASPDLEYPAGDFSSPEYADPSLAEDSPFEYEYEDDADASQEGFSSQDELPRTEVMEDLEAMEEDASLQSNFVDEFALRAREEGLETLVEEQEETQECEIRRTTNSKQTDMGESTASDAIKIPSTEPHATIISQEDTQSQITAEALPNRTCETKQEIFDVGETTGEDKFPREQLKHMQRYPKDEDDANSSSSLTSSQSSEGPPETTQPHKDGKSNHHSRPKPPPLGMMPPRYSMEAYSSMESEEGNSLLSSPRSPSYDTDGFDKPKVKSPSKKHVDLESPLSPGFRFSPPATPKHLLEASKHMSDSSCTYDNSPSEFSDEIQMSPVTLTVCQPVAVRGCSNSDDFFGVPVKASEVANESEAICPDVPLDKEQKNEAAQSPKANEIVRTDVVEQTTNKADACTNTQTEHILSVTIPKPSSTHRHPGEERSQPVKTQSTSSQTTSPVSDAEPSSGSPSAKQTRAKILVDAAVDATFDSPSLSPQSPMHAVPAKTTSIAVGTSPEYSPPSSAPSTDTESVPSRSSRVKYVQGGFGSDGDTTDWGASMPFSSIASSSGTSSPERSSSLRSTPLKYPSHEVSSLSNLSPPTVRRNRVERETSPQRSSSVPGRARLMREHASDRRQTSSSDIDSCDSDGGTPSSTPRKIRRRLPSIPSDQIPVSAPGSSTSHKVFLDGDQNISDPAKQLELQRVKEMLSRKAAAIEKQRRDEELRNLRIEADRQRVGAASERIARRRHAKPRGKYYSDGSVSDSEIGPTGSGRDSRDRDVLDTDWRFGAPALSMQTLNTIENQQSPTHSNKYGLDPVGAPMSTVFLSKSEEDIIREIEKQVSETTGKAYQVYDRSEIEMEVRRRYGPLHDSDRSSSQQSSSSSGSKGSMSDSWSSVTFELSDHRLRVLRQKLKEELKLITADRRAQLDRDAVTNEPTRRAPRGKWSPGSQDFHMMSSTFLQTSRSNGKPQLLAVPGVDRPERNGKPPNSSNRHSPQASPQRRRNRRQAADSIPPMFSPIKEDVDIEGDVLLSQSKLTKQHPDGQESVLLPQEEPVDRRSFRLRGDGTEEPIKSHILTETGSSSNRRRRKDTPGLVKIGPEEVDRLSREGEIIERQIREQQEKEFRRELERRKKQMEDSAKRLDELKVRRGVEWSANGASGVGGSSTTGRTAATAPGPKPIQGPVKLSQSLDEIARRRERDTSPFSDERRRYGSLEMVTRDRSRGAREAVSMSTPQLTERERAIIRRDQQGLILPLDEENRLHKGSSEPGKRQTRTGRTDRLERSSSREKRPHRQDSAESVSSNRGCSEDDDAMYSDSSKGSGRRRRSTEERRTTDESTRHPRHHGRTSPATQRERERDHGRASPATQRESDHGRASPLYARGHHHPHRQQHSRSREDVSGSASGRERAHTISPCSGDSRERDRERDLHRDHRRRQHHHSGEDLSKPSKNNERTTGSQRSRSLPRVLQTDRSQASPEADYYYGDQVYRMQASEWTRRADDSGDDDDERQRQVIYQNVPGGSRHMQQRHISRNDYQFPTRRFRLPRDPRDNKCRNHGIGMRIIGGKRIPGTDQLVAYIAEIRRGGVADREGLREGDQVLEWCGMPLTGRTYEEVQRITRTADGDVEVVVKCGTNLLESPRQRGGKPPDDSAPRSRSTSNPPNYADEETIAEEALRNGVDPRMLSERLEGISKAQYVYSSPTTSANTDISSPKRKGRHRNKKISGEIQIQLDYDEQTGDLIVGILRGRGLAPKDINGLADPFVKTCLLPGRGPENKRKTRYVPKTLTPEWNQTVLYRAIRPQELAIRILEISVWDFDRFTFNDFMGQILIDLSDHHILDNRARWFSLQDQPASTGQQEAFSPRALSPITNLPSSHPGHPLSLLIGGRGRGGPSTTTGSGDHGSPERRRALSRSMERVQAASAAQQLLESDSQSSRSSGYDYDTDRSTQSDKSGWSQEHHRDRQSRAPPPSSSQQHRHAHNGHHPHADRDDRPNGTGRAHTDNARVDHNGNHTAKDPSPSKNQPTKSSPTTSAGSKQSNISTSVKVTVTTKHPTNKHGSKETKEGTQAKKAPDTTKKPPDTTKKQPQDRKAPERREPRRAASADRSSERAKLSPSNVRASKPKNEPSIFHYTSTNPSHRRDAESKRSFKKGASTSKSAQNLSSYHDQPSTAAGFRRSSAELYDDSRSVRLNGPESIDVERGGNSWPSDHVESKIPQPIEVEVKQTGYDDITSRFQQTKDGETVLLNGGHDTERVCGVPRLWVRKPQLERGTGSTLEGNSLMQMNLRAAMYTRMFAGELGPGQIIDPETPRDYETTGEIRLGLKKEIKADGDELYVDVIQCRKISYKFKTEHPPDLYVKGYLVVGDRKVSKKKTHICKFAKEPKFNEVFMYNTSVTGLALQVSLWADGGRFGRNTLLGDTMIWLDNVTFLPSGEAEAWYKLLLPSGKTTSSP